MILIYKTLFQKFSFFKIEEFIRNVSTTKIWSHIVEDHELYNKVVHIFNHNASIMGEVQDIGNM